MHAYIHACTFITLIHSGACTHHTLMHTFTNSCTQSCILSHSCMLAHSCILSHSCLLAHSHINSCMSAHSHILSHTFSHTRRHFPFLSVSLPTFPDEFQGWAGIVYPRHWLHQSCVFEVKLRLEPYRLDANSSLNLRGVLAALARCLEEAPRL